MQTHGVQQKAAVIFDATGIISLDGRSSLSAKVVVSLGSNLIRTNGLVTTKERI
jgi:hypothetical protein